MKEIGEILRKKRNEKNLTLERVHIDTRLSKKFLSALEEGVEEDFPAEVYYTGSLRKYSGYLGLNATELVEMYINAKKHNDIDKFPVNAGKNILSIKHLLYVVVLILLGIMTYNFKHSRPSLQMTPVSEPAKVENLRLNIKSTNDSWIRITVDGKMVYEGVIKLGQEKDFTANERVVLKIGYAPGVKVSVNGRIFDVIKGSVKDVNDITVTKEDIIELLKNESKI